MHTIFIVHGMGTHEAQWGQTAIETLKQEWTKWSALRTYFPFDKHFKIVELSYGQIFQEYIDRQIKAAGSLNAALTALGMDGGLINTLTDAIGKLDGKDFVQSHLLDVVFWRFALQFRSSIVTHLATTIRGHREGKKRMDFSVIAHSLGTSVIHDVLHDMAVQDYKNGLSEPSFQVRVLAMVSNVSKVLDLPNRSVYTSQVRPAAKLRDGVCMNYLTVGNYLDPIWQVDAFRPTDQWKPPYKDRLPPYAEVYFKHAGNINTHDFVAYLEHPSFQAELFQRLLYPGVFGDGGAKEIDDRVTKYSRQLPGNADEIRHRLESIGKVDSLPGLIKAIGDFSAAIREFVP